jgi:hypothetical protein
VFRKWSLPGKFVSVLFGVIFCSSGFTVPVFAQEDAPPEDSYCFCCHEQRYFLYDSGKAFCFCGTGLCCTECHGGSPDTPIEEQAHEGLIANPQEDEAAICQECHPEDYHARVEKFAAIAGIHPTPRPCPTYTPGPTDSHLDENDGGTGVLHALPPGPWQVVGASFLGIAFLSLFLFTCRCWKIDRQPPR